MLSFLLPTKCMRTLVADQGGIWLPTAVASVLIAAFTSAFMIGGKAAGKSIAIEQSANIVLFVGKMMALFERKTTKRKKNKKN